MYFDSNTITMGILAIMAIIVIMVAYLIASKVYRHLLANNTKLPLLWSTLTFGGVCLLLSAGLLYAVSFAFHR